MEAVGRKERPGWGVTGPRLAFKAGVLDVTAWGERSETPETWLRPRPRRPSPSEGLSEEEHSHETESEQLGRQEVGKRATEEGISRRQGLTMVGAAGQPGKAGEWKPKAACSGLKKEFEPSM